ncbi:MAG: dockerin type I domain-containing protein [Candidatus Bathyarchaeota archaeon]|nr:dockerin type I domain-containing protein [Candidatus Bathyarchaeota archaeon]
MFRKMFMPVFVAMLLLSIMVAEGVASSETTVYVDPEESTVKLCQTFTIDVNVVDVSGLQGVDFCLSYDTTILDGLEVEEGPFMASFGLTIVAYEEIDDDYKPTVGRIWFAAAILGDAFADGTGTLATVTFNATAIGESVLDLHSILPYKPDEVKLCTCGPEPITNVAVDGYVVVSSNPCGPLADPPEDPPEESPPNPPDTPHSSDVNGDGVVDIRDLAIVASVYGTLEGYPRYRPEADLNENGEIEIRDIAIVAQDFGKTL